MTELPIVMRCPFCQTHWAASVLGATPRTLECCACGIRILWTVYEALYKETPSLRAAA
jgi:hypothetical protein